jgi:hypothetical protein
MKEQASAPYEVTGGFLVADRCPAWVQVAGGGITDGPQGWQVGLLAVWQLPAILIPLSP